MRGKQWRKWIARVLELLTMSNRRRRGRAGTWRRTAGRADGAPDGTAPIGFGEALEKLQRRFAGRTFDDSAALIREDRER